MTPDKSAANGAAEDHTLSDDGRPLWAAPQVTKFEVIRTLGRLRSQCRQPWECPDHYPLSAASFGERGWPVRRLTGLLRDRLPTRNYQLCGAIHAAVTRPSPGP